MVPGAVIAKKYRLEAHLAKGGMGAVWTARHVTLGHLVAVKFLDPRLASSASFVTRFEREARAAATAQSPHIVRVHDFGFEDGTPYLVMELLRGEDLRSRIRRMGRLSLSVTAGILVQVGKGLRRAHEAGIVHRDIKPGNLFLARGDDEEVVKILDFGIAKEPAQALDEHTKTGELVGSPHYVSPEQARGEKDLDHRSDVWSTGVIAFRMVTGHLPFPGEGLGQVLSKVLTADPPKVGSLVPGLPASLDGFFAKALAKKKEERFSSMRELVDAFVELTQKDGSEDESVPPPSWSTIVNLSIPPPAPLGSVPIATAGSAGSAGSAGLDAGKDKPHPKGAEGLGAGLGAQDLAEVAPRSVRRAQMIDALIAAETGGRRAAESEARHAAPLEPGEPPSADEAGESREGKRDSLVPSMAAKLVSPPPMVRFRWAAVVALGMSAMVTVGAAWLRDHSAKTTSSASPAETVPAAPFPPPPPPPSAEAKATPPVSPAPVPSGTAGTPRSTADPMSSAPTATAKIATAPMTTNVPQARPADAAPQGSPVTTTTRRKWGF